jgi:hypothetical protein
MTDPYIDILSRELENELSEKLQNISRSLEEFVNFGTKILEWDAEQLVGEEESVIPLLFLRNFLDKIDAISILIKYSSNESCKILLRTALETAFYLEYLLENNTKERSMMYLVWSRMEQDKFVLKFDGKSEQFKEYRAKHLKDKLVRESPEIKINNPQEKIEISRRLLNSTKYKPFTEEYYKQKKLTKKVPSWYSLFGGPKNIEELANNSNLHTFYEILYREWSYATHGTDAFPGKMKFKENTGLEIIEIRNQELLMTIATNCCSISVLVFKTYVSKKLPSKKAEFNSWTRSINNILKELKNYSLQ